MANQQNSYTGSQGTGTNNADFAFTFPSFKTSEVRVEVDNVVKSLTTHYTVENYNTTSGGTVRFTAGNIPTGSTPVRIFRETDVDTAKATFVAGSSLKAGEINDNFKQVLHALQEAIGADATDRKIQTFNIEDEAITSAKIKDLTIVDADIAAGAEIEVYKLKDGGANQVLVTQSDGTTVGWSSSVDLGGTLDVTGDVDFDANLNVDGNLTVDGTANLDDTNVAGSFYVIGTALVDNVLIDDNSITSGSGDLNLSSSYGNVSVNDNLAVTGTLNVTQGVTLQNASATVNGSQIVTETASQTLTNKTLTTPVINDMSGTAVVTSGTSTSDNKVYSAKRAGEIFYGKDTVEEIQSGETWSAADNKIATTAAIDARIIDLVDDVGGFVPIANETSFPTTNPDINTSGSSKGGTIVSVKTASTNLVPSGTTVTIANGRGSGLAVIITGVPSTIPSGFGFLVETTATDHTYAFHRLTPKATEVTTVAGKATEIGRLGTADAVADMAILGTTDVVADMNLLATNDVVADMNMLATSDVVSDMNTLAVTSVLNNMDTVATNVTNVNNVGGSIANVNTTAGSIANVNTVAGAIANVNTVSGAITNVNNVGGSIANVNSVASNLASVNSFANTYRIGADNPDTSLDVGDLFFNTTSNSLKVYTGSAWVDGVTATGNFALKTGNTFTGSNVHNDNVKSTFGTGSDFDIFHDGTNSRLNSASHNLNVRTPRFGVFNGGGTETMLLATADGSVELYEDNVKKAETTADGFNVEGILYANGLDMDDSHIAKIGLGDDLQIYHDGNTSYVSNTTNTGLLIRNLGNGDIKIKPQNSYPVELYYNGAKKFETSSAGAVVTGSLGIGTSSPGGKLSVFDSSSAVFRLETPGVIAISHTFNGTDYTIANNDGSNGHSIIFGSKAAGAESMRINSSGHVQIANDSGKLQLGASQDLQIYHDGSYNRFVGASFVFMNAAANEYIIEGFQDGDVRLYYDNSKKLETESWGVDVTGDLRATELKLEDNNYLTIGSGNDLRLRHDASNSFIYNNTGDLYLDSSSSGSIHFTQGGTAEVMASMNANGSVTLRYDNSIKLATASDKINFYADAKVNDHNTYNLGADGARWRDLWIGNNIYLPDAGEVRLGNSGDLQLYHDGNNSVINDTGTGRLKLISSNVQIRNAANTENIAEFIQDGAVELYHNGSKKFETTAAGSTASGVLTANQLSVTNGLTANLQTNGYNLELGDSHSGIAFRNRIKLGASEDFQLYHYNGDNYINITNDQEIRLTHGSDYLARFIAEGGVKLFYDNSEKLETTSSGVSTGGLMNFNGTGDKILIGDNGKIALGGSLDLQIYFDGSVGIIKNASNDLALRSDGNIKLEREDGGEDYIHCIQDGSVEIHYNGAAKLWTNSSGLTSNGNIIPYQSSQYDLGSSSYRWANLYVNDMHFANSPENVNSVDGTWGDWTLQEGEETIYMLNNRNGKKYKMALQEVS